MYQRLASSMDGPKLERIILLGVITLLMLACAWTAAGFVGLMWGNDRWTLTSPFNRDASEAARAPTKSLADYHLFGASGSSPGAGIAIKAPETEMDLLLRGTVYAMDQQEALAIIANENGEEKTYAVGDELPGSAELYRVEVNRVLLRTSEGIEALSLRAPEASPQTAPATPRSAADIRVVAQPATVDWQAMRRSLLADPERLAQSVSALPVVQNGDLVGFRLRSGRDAALLSQLGLRQSDVITAVNGIELNDYGKAADILAELKTAPRLNVTVLRNGRQEQINISLNP